ncbi:complement factor H-related protein 1-like isoform X10 [Gymnodraco acuticeps]|uniref:Complement factor H-related protein 1-like isoform X10 n=1 Tax=Gymnodraco acuticeps TaxID=8218 RepID=A0A6P8V1D9_GYMAC|nr:complement factor H-related protein 1-like isoform X10 [Gymnodraco acuticeps]
MSVGYLGFVLLLWFPGVLHAHNETQNCTASSLSQGYVVPEQKTYLHEATLTYACDNGLKPAVEGWWATSKCQNGKWSPDPQCIDEKACVSLTIPNGNYDASTDGWYGDRDKIRVKCDEGYEHKDHDAAAQCSDGAWVSVPICERSTESCGDPPKKKHAVIIGKGYQEVFAASSKLQYKCEDGYTAEGADTKTIFCILGNWTEGPTCKVGTGGRHTTSAGSGVQPAGGDRIPDTGHGGATVGGTDGGDTTSAGSGRQPAGREVGTGGGDTTSAGSGIQPAGGDRIPDTGHGGATVGGTGGGDTTSAGSGIQPAGREVGTGGGDTTSAGSGIQPAGRDRIPDTGHGGATVGGTGGGDTTSAGSGRQPAGRDANCGKHPSLLNGDVVEVSRTSLKYECNGFYTLEGPDIVTCQSNGKWTEPPSCKAAFCVIDPAQTRMANLKISQGLVYVKEGLNKYIPCRWPDSFRLVQCINGRISYTYCCSGNDHYYRSCPVEGWTENRSTVGSI